MSNATLIPAGTDEQIVIPQEVSTPTVVNVQGAQDTRVMDSCQPHRQPDDYINTAWQYPDRELTYTVSHTVSNQKLAQETSTLGERFIDFIVKGVATLLVGTFAFLFIRFLLTGG